MINNMIDNYDNEEYEKINRIIFICICIVAITTIGVFIGLDKLSYISNNNIHNHIGDTYTTNIKNANIGDTINVYNNKGSLCLKYKILDSGKYNDKFITSKKTEKHIYTYIEISITNLSNNNIIPNDIEFYANNKMITNNSIPYSTNTLIMKDIKPNKTLKGTVYKLDETYDTDINILAKIYGVSIRIK